MQILMLCCCSCCCGCYNGNGCCRLPGVQGAYVATGHSCWGILNGPATGQAMAELIVYGSTKSLDISAFDPARVCNVRQ